MIGPDDAAGGAAGGGGGGRAGGAGLAQTNSERAASDGDKDTQPSYESQSSDPSSSVNADRVVSAPA